VNDTVGALDLPAASGQARWTAHHPLERIVLLGCLLLGVLVTESTAAGLAVLMTTTLLATRSGDIPLQRWVVALLLPLGFLVPAALALAVRVGAEGSTLPAGVALSRDGLALGWGVVVRTLACVSCTLLFIMTTPVHIIALAMRRAGASAALSDTVLITARLIQLLGARMVTISRTLVQRHGTVSWRARLRSVSLLGATLLVDSLERSMRLERGLAGRGGLTGDAIARPAWLALDRARLWTAIMLPAAVVFTSAYAVRALSVVAGWVW